jgi:hypothetical protein
MEQADDKLAVVFLQRRPKKGWFAVTEVSYMEATTEQS